MFYKVYVSFNKDFIRVVGDHIEIGVKARPLKGEADADIIKKIAKHLGISKSNVTIVAGERSRNKVVQVAT